MDRVLPYIVIICLIALGVTQVFFYREAQQSAALVGHSLDLGAYNWDQVKETDSRAIKLSATVARHEREIASLQARLDVIERAIIRDEEARETYEKAHGKEP